MNPQPFESWLNVRMWNCWIFFFFFIFKFSSSFGKCDNAIYLSLREVVKNVECHSLCQCHVDIVNTSKYLLFKDYLACFSHLQLIPQWHKITLNYNQLTVFIEKLLFHFWALLFYFLISLSLCCRCFFSTSVLLIFDSV